MRYALSLGWGGPGFAATLGMSLLLRMVFGVLGLLLFLPSCTADRWYSRTGPKQLNQLPPPPRTVSENICKTSVVLQQPQLTGQKLDLLLVTDTSGSMKQELQVLGQQMNTFFTTLLAQYPGLDYRVAVMLAHAETEHSGALFNPMEDCGNQAVLSGVGPWTPANATSLSCKLENVEGTPGHLPLGEKEDGGEAGIASVIRAGTTNLAAIRSQGFFREDAGLSVIFAADENDICSMPEGYYSVFPDVEESAFVQSGRCEGRTPQAGYAALQSIVGTRPLSLAVMAHLDPTQRHYGWGYLGGMFPLGATPGPFTGLVDLAGTAGIAVQIEDTAPQVSLNLEMIAQSALQQFWKQTRFPMPPKTAVEWVKVDGAIVDYTWNEQTQEIQIAFEDAGEQGSKIEIAHCEQP